MSLFSKEYIEQNFMPLSKADKDYSPFDHGTEVDGSYKPTSYPNATGKEVWEDEKYQDVLTDEIY